MGGNASQRERVHVSMMSGNTGVRPLSLEDTVTHATQTQSGSLENPVYELRSIMEHKLQHTISLLNRTPAVLKYASACSTKNVAFRNERENTWSAFDVVGHLGHGETHGLDTTGEDSAASLAGIRRFQRGSVPNEPSPGLV
jgi:hypothetical protein